MKKILLPIAAAAAFSMNADAALLTLEFGGTLRDIDERSDSDSILNGARNADFVTGRFIINSPVPADEEARNTNYGNYKSNINWINTEFDNFTYRIDQARGVYPFGFQKDNVELLNSDTVDFLYIEDFYTPDPSDDNCSNIFCSSIFLKGDTGRRAPLAINPFSGDGFPGDLSAVAGVNLLGQPDFAQVQFTIWDGLSGGVTQKATGNIHLDYLRVAPVPLPAGVWLFMTAIAGGLAYRRKALKK